MSTMTAPRGGASRKGKVTRDRAGQILRMLTLLRTLADARRPHTVTEICEEVYGEYTPRARRIFYRDLRTLRKAEIDVDAETLPGLAEVAYRLRTIPSMVRVAPGEDQIFVFSVARNLVGAHLGPAMRQAFDALWDRVARELPRPLADFSAYCQSYFMARPPLGRARDIDAETVRTLARALMDNRKLRLRYRKDEDAPVDTHTVHPYFVVVVDGVLYLHGHSEERRQPRSFALDRVVGMELLSETFERDPAYDYAELDAEDVFERSFKAFLRAERDRPAEAVTLEFSRRVARFVRNRSWHPTQSVERLADGRVRLSLKCEITGDFRAWVLSFGRDVKVTAPKAFAKEIADEHRAAAR